MVDIPTIDFIYKSLGLVAFFSMALISIIFNDKKITKRIFVITFFILMFAGVFGLVGWPFSDWALFSDIQPTNMTYTEVRIADGQGKEIRYDAHAVPPVLGAVLHRRYPEKMKREKKRYNLELGNHLLKEARKYRKNVNDDSAYSINNRFPRGLRFPRHQLDYQWSSEEINRVGKFRELRIYEINHKITEDGKKVLSKEENLVMKINETHVTRMSRWSK
jgi:hypothetical protein